MKSISTHTFTTCIKANIKRAVIVHRERERDNTTTTIFSLLPWHYYDFSISACNLGSSNVIIRRYRDGGKRKRRNKKRGK